MSKRRLPQRIACLSTETVEVLYALGEQERIAGISGFTVKPPQARKEKPKISGFSTARIDKILAVEPDLVLAYSNLQAEIGHELVSAGLPVYAFNQHTVDGILAMIASVGRLVGAEEKALAMVDELEAIIAAAQSAAAQLPRRPRVYFEEWNEPLMSGIGWASELIALAGGEDIFADLAVHHSARQRIIADPLEVVRRAPDIIIGSWCGKHFQPEHVTSRPGWDAVPAVANGQLHELKSAVILTPGPSAISEGLPALARIFSAWAQGQ
jgi:iron complex transport system substrate-binding protein